MAYWSGPCLVVHILYWSRAWTPSLERGMDRQYGRNQNSRQGTFYITAIMVYEAPWNVTGLLVAPPI